MYEYFYIIKYSNDYKMFISTIFLSCTIFLFLSDFVSRLLSLFGQSQLEPLYYSFFKADVIPMMSSTVIVELSPPCGEECLLACLETVSRKV